MLTIESLAFDAADQFRSQSQGLNIRYPNPLFVVETVIALAGMPVDHGPELITDNCSTGFHRAPANHVDHFIDRLARLFDQIDHRQ